MDTNNIQILYQENDTKLYVMAQMSTEDYQKIEFAPDSELLAVAKVLGKAQSLDELAEKSFRQTGNFRDLKLGSIISVRADSELDADENGNLKYLTVDLENMVYFKEKYIGALQ